MASLQVFDRINDINAPKLRSLPYEQYFGEMNLTEEQKKERIALAEKLEDVMRFMFYLFITQNEFEGMTADDIKTEFQRRLRNTVGENVEISSDIERQIEDFADEVADTTAVHLPVLLALPDEPEDEKTKKKKESEEYYLSDDRARFLAEEEANSVYGYSDYEKAIRLGYKYKTWVTMRDRFVRKTHERVDGKTIPIKELFAVGKRSLMRFPRDEKYSPEAREVISCRCICKYSK